MKKKANNKTSKKKQSTKYEWLKAFIIALFLILLLRIFAFQFYVMPDSKMESTLYTGDYVIINKLSFGARLSIPFFNDTVDNKFNYFRFFGFTDISRNDILLFNYPAESGIAVNNKTKLLKRCVALPEDTINIVDKKVFVNGTCVDITNDTKYRFRVFSVSELSNEFYKKHSINEGGSIDSSFVYDFFISKKTAEEIINDSLIKKVNLIKLQRNAKSNIFFPQSKNFNWNLDYFGPVFVPAKGKFINIDFKNIDIYKKVIEVYENNKLEIKDKRIYINDSLSTKYKFKLDYYFVLDDNRDNGKDSRYWGFVPESYIIGKANFVLFSIGSNNKQKYFIWNRIFKML